MSIVVHCAISLVFGLGLVIAGMSNPAKVLNFLDLGAIPDGGWDMRLAFVMGGAIVVTFIKQGQGVAVAARSSATGTHQVPSAPSRDGPSPWTLNL